MRRAVGIGAVALAVVCAVAGLVVLLLPYDQTVGVAGFAETVEVRCQGPLIDAASSDDADGGWFLLDPNSGVTFSGDVDDTGEGSGTVTTGGSLCYPDSVQRGAIGAALLTVGATGLLGWQLVRTRRRSDDEVSPEA